MSKIILELPDSLGRVSLHLNYDVFNEASLSYVPVTHYYNSFEVLPRGSVSLSVFNKISEPDV